MFLKSKIKRDAEALSRSASRIEYDQGTGLYGNGQLVLWFDGWDRCEITLDRHLRRNIGGTVSDEISGLIRVDREVLSPREAEALWHAALAEYERRSQMPDGVMAKVSAELHCTSVEPSKSIDQHGERVHNHNAALARSAGIS